MLAPAVRTQWRIGTAVEITLLCALCCVAAVLLWRENARWIVSITATLFALTGALVVWRVPSRRYDAWRYELGADALRLARGHLFKVEQVVPYSRIQHVDTQQGPLERSLGLSRVIIYTASGSGESITIPGLLPPVAAELREQLAALADVLEPL